MITSNIFSVKKYHHCLQTIKPYLVTEEELILTKVKLASIYQENARLHNTLDKIWRLAPSGAALAANHKSAAELALAVADTITHDVEVLRGTKL